MTSKSVHGTPVVAGVIGYPIKHSRSPLIHNHWLAAHGIAGCYSALEIHPDDLEAQVSALAARGLKGINATVPHKEAIFALAGERDEAAEKIGAVNTVIFKESGEFLGINTDAKGFIANLETARTRWQDAPALVLGAGGASRAVVYGLMQAGVRTVRIANRTRARAEALARDLAAPGHALETLAWEDVAANMSDLGLLVNATSLGLEGGSPLALDLNTLNSGALVTDIVYAPLQTPLLHAAADAGHETIDGLGMLVHQARFAFEAWFGILPEADAALRSTLEADLQKP